MNKEVLLDLKIKGIERLIKIDELLIEAVEKGQIDSMDSLMKEKFAIIDKINEIDNKIKEKGENKNFSEQDKKRFRYIKESLDRLKKSEELLLSIAQQRLEKIRSEIQQIDETVKIMKKYNIKSERKNIFERIG